MVRLTLMYYIDFVAFMENPDKTLDDILAKQAQKSHPNLHFLIMGAYFLKKVRSLVLRDFGQIFCVLLSFTGQQLFSFVYFCIFCCKIIAHLKNYNYLCPITNFFDGKPWK